MFHVLKAIYFFSSNLSIDCATTDTMHTFVENVYNYALEKSEKARRTSGQVLGDP